jgi:dTDP-4-dehydrorhamnose 3,5-epimerase
VKAEATAIADVLILEPQVFGDDRGFFLESWRRDLFRELTGCEADFVQDNHSSSARDVLRGLHLQVPPHAQGKLVRVVRGAIWDVAVDIRPDSPTFRRWVGVELSEANRRQLWVPPGLAHGFLTLEEGSEVLYKTTDVYAPECERTIAWDDPELAVAWPLDDRVPVLSAKDQAGLALADFLATT